MKIQVETNVKSWVTSQARTLIVLAVEAVAVLAFIGAAWFYGLYQPIFRDFVVANVAHVRAGEVLPFEDGEAGYQRGFKIDEYNVWAYGIESNNMWMAEYTRLIIPYMDYEQVTAQSIYPDAVGSIPLVGNQSFHVGGRMYHDTNEIILNERMFIDERWNDKRRALSTLVHELVHIQRGAYTSGTSAERETATSTATIEVLAGMCNYGDSLACSTFWREIEHLARTSMIVQLNDVGAVGIYNAWADLVWRDTAEIDAYNKSMRFWNEAPGELMELYKKYSITPWQNVVLGVTDGIPLNTGHVVCVSETWFGQVTANSVCRVLGMPFSDTWYLLQNLIWILE